MIVNVLTSIPEEYKENIKLGDFKTRVSIESICEDTCIALKNLYPTVFTEDTELVVSSTISGLESPAVIESFVANWNQRNSLKVVEEIQHIEFEAKEMGCTSISEYLTALIESDGTFREMHWPASLEHLRKALDINSNIFPYGSDAMVAVNLHYKDYNFKDKVAEGIRLSSEVLRHIKAHPENYMIIRFEY